MLDQAFLFGVSVEPRDRAQPPGHSRSSPAGRFQITAKAFDVDTVHVEEPTVVFGTPDNELSQVKRVASRVEPT